MQEDAHERVESLEDSNALVEHITGALHGVRDRVDLSENRTEPGIVASSVLFLIGPRCAGEPDATEPCVILNKRSSLVKQPGDLCFPGGSIASGMDAWIARLLRLPGLPLSRWPHWGTWKDQWPENARRLALLLATGLRESFEEMRLNPLRVSFLGPLPAQRLIMFRRVIHPMVVWVSRQQRFIPNWEVETVVSIPLKDLLDHSSYARYHLSVENDPGSSESSFQAYPCFIHETGETREILWGATFRIVMTFLALVFGFVPPPMGSLEVVRGVLKETYFSGVA